MNENDFIGAISTIRVWEKKLIGSSSMQRMVDSQNFEECIRLLSEGDYDLSVIKNMKEYETVLKNALVKLYDNLYKISPSEDVVNLMALKYEYNNLKLIVKSKITGKNFDYYINVFKDGIYNQREKIVNGDYKDLSPKYKNMLNEVFEKYENEKDITIVDILFDKFMFSEMIEISEKLKSEFVIDLVKNQIDMYNLKTFLRTKRLKLNPKILLETLFEGGFIEVERYMKAYEDSIDVIISKFSKSKYGDLIKEALENYGSLNKLNELEKLSDNYIMDNSRKSKFTAFGMTPLFTFILSKETEIKNLRIILTGKLNEVSPKIIGERLREGYV